MYRKPGIRRWSGGGEPSSDDKLPPARLDGLDHLVVVEPGIRANPDLVHRFGQLTEARLEQLDRPPGGVDVAGPQFPMPAVLGLPLEADQRVVRGAPPLAWIVANARLLLMPVQRQHRGVQVQQDPAEGVGPLAEVPEQPIVQATESGQAAEGEAVGWG